MLALGCFIPFVTLAIGAGLGSYVGAVRGGYWGAAVGLGTGTLIVAAGFMMLGKARGND